MLNSLTAYDFVRALATKFNLQNTDQLEAYYKFMDDLCLYSLMSDQYAFNSPINCLMGSLIYFTARNDDSTLTQVYLAFKLIVTKKEIKETKLDTHKDFALLKLRELGAKEEELSVIDKRINVALCF